MLGRGGKDMKLGRIMAVGWRMRWRTYLGILAARDEGKMGLRDYEEEEREGILLRRPRRE